MSMTHDEMIAVIAAHRDGKAIQFRRHGDSKWTGYLDGNSPEWLFSICDYRIKPEPLECWVNVYPNGVRTYWLDEPSAIHHCGSLGRTVHMKEVES